MMETVNDTQDMSHVDAAMHALERATREVIRGDGDANRLAAGLEAALAETVSFSRLLADDTFTGDEASTAWRVGAAENVDQLRQALSDMLTAARACPIEADALLAAFDRTLEAEGRVREVHRAAEALQIAGREALSQAQSTPCVRCGHRTPAGRSTCEACRFPLPSMGVERIETDVVGGEPPPDTSVFLARLDELIAALETTGSQEDLLEFLQNLERLYILGGRQLDAVLRQVPREHEAVILTAELRTRIEGVRQMAEAVRLSVAAGDAGMLGDFRQWLAEQVEILLDLNARVEAACA